jgi:hypothetical protein
LAGFFATNYTNLKEESKEKIRANSRFAIRGRDFISDNIPSSGNQKSEILSDVSSITAPGGSLW